MDTTDRRGRLKGIVWGLTAALTLALALTLAGCGPQERQGQQAPPEAPELPKWEEYAYKDKIQQTLYELVASRDPEAAAERLGLDAYWMVRVVLVLKDEEAELPEGVLIYVERRVGNEVQALVPVEQLLKLVEHPQVQYVRAPVKPRKL